MRVCRSSAEDEELAAACHAWSLAPTAASAKESAATRHARHKGDKLRIRVAKSAHLTALLERGSARIAATSPLTSIAGRVVKVLDRYKVGAAVEGLLVDVDGCTFNVPALELKHAGAPDLNAPGLEMSAPDAEADADAEADSAPMDVEEETRRTPLRKRPEHIIKRVDFPTDEGAYPVDSSVERDIDKQLTPPSLRRAWARVAPDEASADAFFDERFDYWIDHIRTGDGPFANPPVGSGWLGFMRREENFPRGLRRFASPSGSRFWHPPECQCGRASCPVPLGW